MRKSILTLDIATATGWAFATKTCVSRWPLRVPMHEYDPLVGVEFGCRTFQPSVELRGALFHAFDSWLSDLITNLEPDLIVKESVFVGPNKQTAMLLGSLGALAELIAYRREVPIYDVSAPDIKKFVTGKGNASKGDVIQWATRMGWKVRTSDEADALALLEYSVADLSRRERAA